MNPLDPNNPVLAGIIHARVTDKLHEVEPGDETRAIRVTIQLLTRNLMWRLLYIGAEITALVLIVIVAAISAVYYTTLTPAEQLWTYAACIAVFIFSKYQCRKLEVGFVILRTFIELLKERRSAIEAKAVADIENAIAKAGTSNN